MLFKEKYILGAKFAVNYTGSNNLRDEISMKPVFRLKKRVDIGKLALQGFLAACCVGITVNANAVVDDDPYFQLFPGAPYDFNANTSPGAALGDDTSVSICGAAAGGSCTAEILVEVANENPSGTGYIYSFLRLNEPNNNGQDKDNTGLTTESGYNTNFPTLQEDSIFDNDSQDSPGVGNDWNRAVLISDLKAVDGFYQIVLDLDEQGNNPGEYIRLDEFEIHTSSDGMLREYNPNDPGAGSFGAGGWDGIVFDMDVWKDYPDGSFDEGAGPGGLVLKTCEGTAPATGGKCGSGTYDYVFNIPVELLAGREYMHVVATLGAGSYEEGDWNPEAFAGAGFDEFAAVLCEEGEICDGGKVPVPGTALLIGLGLMGIFGRRRIMA
jgi:PEP-CTERM motif